MDAAIGVDRDQVFRITIGDREEGPRGIPTRAFVGDPESAGYRKFKAGVLEFATLLPPNSNIEPTPADKDPAPDPFDSTYNTPEHDAFVNDVKYIRDDRFVVEHMLDDATRVRLDNAWNDLRASFAYHDNYLRLLAEHFKLDLKGSTSPNSTRRTSTPCPPRRASTSPPCTPSTLPCAPPRPPPARAILPIASSFAAIAWRHPLSEKEKQSLRTFYDKAMTSEGDHDKAIRALLDPHSGLARIPLPRRTARWKPRPPSRSAIGIWPAA